MRYLIVLLLAGCASSEGFGNTCVSAGMKVGDGIRNLETGTAGRVVRVYGPAPTRCKDAGHPNLADVQY